ncbi:heavy-metal-associated domain-containing protein [Chitinophaga sancti]|uniref:Copper chaperone CopZ n=1 Tax=Chitinophaga sancti TaxID=1004 RepID=A0A1K1SFD4_9BACT|nr:heavy-metal-associated domain-containing protein [Chitinophaga sancti]WQD59816.1 heavy-metal-associated domain-containing protein [Chitinophaga sancti]WQG88053.1 heavy-metal-associated domain-containing protein [Chitinophaga sancti]SFW83096.1 Copper chaperone CopZ [Chitinophaga sancti]
MKKIFSLLVLMITFLGASKVFAQTVKTETFKVYGNCNMCKKRIEKAVVADGITKADWNVDTKVMTVSYDPTKISNDAIQKKVAGAGHDTEKEKASDSIYAKLPGCCRYDRNGGAIAPTHDHHR